MKHPTHLMVIYDGISNSVFQGQVVAPLIAYRQEHPETPMLLISFETDTNNTLFADLANHLNTHQITLTIIRKYPLIHTAILRYATYRLRNLLKNYSAYTLTARGPLAGYLCLNAHTTPACTSLTIQARGLLAAEYEYATQNTRHRIWKWYHWYKIRLFSHLEQMVYSRNVFHLTIEAVSPALKEYLVTTYNVTRSQIRIAHYDIPSAISLKQKQTWRTATRASLTISDTTHVYCYNGSAKAWQCPSKTVAYFYAQWQKNPDSLLLILTQDTLEFAQIIASYQLSHISYKILHVPHAQIYQYLAACDTGIIFRDAHIINWISRPTKILEYQTVDLSIVHNGTIAYLAQEPHPRLTRAE